ncbi:hypothetical protein AKJ40_03455 [candidate division MSBL1 archaeon SCGC-AAA259M10]|uniref:Uncharacterized protein n=1 Tax=candidate division MSBL1 archaeon SCGC-AAA259M10 TaxID=1698270 RepID=A0A133UYR1_9EURY|nr:hypothetical protein AKJ40_03455 [candidate division MSBL1 archaeon SCGC-AAA259M10]
MIPGFNSKIPLQSWILAGTVKNLGFALPGGSSLVVEPATSIPRIAKRNGSHLYIINLENTRLDGIAEVVIQEKAGKVLPKLP